jgi:voltage-gated potassium channel Kch
MTSILVITIVGIFIVHTVEIWIWAVLYRWLGEFESMERALYFSTVTFTTLGYGDITLHERWQLLSSFEAANGIILFGVSTAFVFGAIRKLFEITEIIKADNA